MAAVVSTVWLPEERLEPLNSFVKYHLAVGFEHVFVFLDCPTQEQHALLSRYPPSLVSVYDRSPELLELQKHRCSKFSDLESYLGDEVQARQTLNAELAMRMSEDRGLRWLLHIDVDELFSSPSVSVEEHFRDLETQGINSITYANHEGVPERLDTDDYFATITLFRRNSFNLKLSNGVRECVQFWRNRTTHAQYFLLYDNGKSACRVGLGAVPKDVHTWALPPALSQTHFMTFADPRNPQIDRVLDMMEPCILHFATCGVSWLRDKYVRLGTFPDGWFKGRIPIAPSFHLHARDVVCSSNAGAAQPDPVTQLYCQQILFDTHLHTQEYRIQMAHGVLFRRTLHQSILQATKNITPSLLREHTLGLTLTSAVPDVIEEPIPAVDSKTPVHTRSTPVHEIAAASDSSVDRAWILSAVMQEYLLPRGNP